MKVNADAIAQAGLDLLQPLGLGGLTMRAVAKELDVQAAALYWHFKNKQQLLDAMATMMVTEATQDIGTTATDWEHLLTTFAGSLRAVALRYRDGARVMAGTAISDTTVHNVLEDILRVFRDAGFSVTQAARCISSATHYAIGFTIEEQAHTTDDYRIDPYNPDNIDEIVDTQRFPLTAQAWRQQTTADADADFQFGLRLLLAGIREIRDNGRLEAEDQVGDDGDDRDRDHRAQHEQQ